MSRRLAWEQFMGREKGRGKKWGYVEGKMGSIKWQLLLLDFILHFATGHVP